MYLQRKLREGNCWLLGVIKGCQSSFLHQASRRTSLMKEGYGEEKQENRSTRLQKREKGPVAERWQTQTATKVKLVQLLSLDGCEPHEATLTSPLNSGFVHSLCSHCARCRSGLAVLHLQGVESKKGP